jgi:N-acetylmuramoyl-L-alanine amidase
MTPRPRIALAAVVALLVLPAAAHADRPGQRLPLEGRVIVLDPGHNGGNWTNPGAIAHEVWAGTHYKACDTLGARTANDYREAAHNWDVALRLRDLLRARGARVVMTRSSNHGVGPCLTKRAAIGNRARADAVLSIHADGAVDDELRGFHVIVPERVRGQTARMVTRSNALGLAIRDALRDHGPTPVSNYQGTDGIIARADLGGLNLSTVPKVFTEIGNMRSSHDAPILESPAGRQQEAEALAIGLTRFLTGRRA